jgi:hypothetical protein
MMRLDGSGLGEEYCVTNHVVVVLGGLVVSVLDPRFAGSIPAEVDGFLKGDKNP